MKVRLIVKETYQPPIDTPASISWKTIVIENKELSEMLYSDDKKYKYSTFEVIGAERVEQ